MPAVCHLLINRDDAVCYRAVDTLSSFRTNDARGALQNLMFCVKNSKELSFRNRVALCIEQIAENDPNLLVPMYATRLEDPDRYARQNAADRLGRFGSDARASVPALLAALNDPSGRVRCAAAAALKLTDPDAAAKAGVP